MTRLTAFVVLSACLGGGISRAQHDPQRNATQQIAAKNFERFEKEIAKGKPEDPETLFVRMMAALQQGELDEAENLAQAALDARLPFERLMGGPRELLAPLRQTESWKTWWKEFNGEQIQILHGPMVGSVTDRSASIWVRTSHPAVVGVRSGEHQSAQVSATEASDLTAVITLEGLEPATRYDYEVVVDGEVVPVGDPFFSTSAAQGEGSVFNVVFGGGAGYVPEWERMWDTIGRFEPQALLMLGDNVYIDQPEFRLCQDYCYYRRQARPEWRRLVGRTPVYAIYDDHDFGRNDCVPGPEIEKPTWKREVWNVFRQNWVNPAYGGGEEQPGCWFDFHVGDVHFILVDGRYYRDRESGSMLGPVQLAWLKETLRNSKGTFKVIASPVPFTEGIKPGSKDPWDGYPEERESIFAFIESEKIDGVFLVAADRHRTDLRTTERPNGYTLYEFESSRLTNRHTHKVIETPGLIWGYSQTCSFGLMRFDTTTENPTVIFECVTIDGEIEETYTLPVSRLKH